MKMNRLAIVIFFLGITKFILVACSSGTPSIPIVTATLPTITTTPSSISVTPTASPTRRVSRPSKTPTPIIDPTELAIYNKQATARAQIWNNKATQVAQFPELDTVTCGVYSSNAIVNSSEISPDGKWIAMDCSDNQTLVVQNKEGARWALSFKDFLSPNSPAQMTGELSPKFWSPDGTYLYFTTRLGYSGGGNQCFPGFPSIGDYGLFRLNLENGSWATLISPTDSFPGYMIEFAPTGRRYATDMGGVMIADINTGKVTKISNTFPETLSWSSNGIQLAYSTASCGDQWVETSSAYVWNATTNQTQLLVRTDGILLKEIIWIDDSTIRITGEKFDEFTLLPTYTIYLYDIAQNSLVFTGTATPSP